MKFEQVEGIGWLSRVLSRRKSTEKENLLATEDLAVWTLSPSLPSASHLFSTDRVEGVQRAVEAGHTIHFRAYFSSYE